MSQRKPEVMSPAGYWPQLHAAIEAGADAVYFGLTHFSARAKVGFSLDELPKAMDTLRRRGVRGYITFNTLVFEHEFPEAARAVAAISDSGADAMIVQDHGIARLARRIAPDLELHASTQMSITNADGVRFAQDLGIRRVTLARELALGEIRAILAETGCDLEIFVHGALCVAYSGQCFSSEAWGGRSANRGQCAQACRLPYELFVDGRLRPLADARYLLSPGDLYALGQVPEIVQMGVAALKIEGRYKDADYVALTTRAYRAAVDAAWAGRASAVDPKQELQLEQVYSRGLGPFFLNGTNHQAVVNGRAPRHRGLRMGRVTHVERDRVVAEASPAHDVAPLKAGDGIVFDAADWRSPEEPEEGGRIYKVLSRPDGNLEIEFGNGAIRFDRIRPGDLVWRTHDPDVDRAARLFTHATAPVSLQRVHVRVTAAEGEPLATAWSLENGVEVTVRSTSALDTAQNHPLSPESLREKLGRLGNTPYELADLDLEVIGSPFVPMSLLNQLRREAVEQLQTAQSRPRHAPAGDPVEILAAMKPGMGITADTGAPEIHVLVRTPEQLEAALVLAPASITLDYLDLYGLRPSVDRIKSSGIAARVAGPRVMKTGEERILQFLLSLDCAILVRSSGLLRALCGTKHPALIGDFSLNAANSLTAETLLGLGLARITPTHDLNAAQVADLAGKTGAGRLEVVAYQHLPVFHTEHCVFCRFLSNGTSYLDCGRPCEEHRIALKDPAGRTHPVMADVGCRNTVFGAEAQEASRHFEVWSRAGIRHFRLEFVHESADQVRGVVEAFDAAIASRMTPLQLAGVLRDIAPSGVTEGSLFVPGANLQLPILQ